jgi:hypothetical protein
MPGRSGVYGGPLLMPLVNATPQKATPGTRTGTGPSAAPRPARFTCRLHSADLPQEAADQRLADFLVQLEALRRKHEARGHRFLDSQGKELPIL